MPKLETNGSDLIRSQHHRPVVFLDRDGTLIEDRGNLRSPTEVIFFENTFEALQRLQEQFSLFIVTNQAGVAEGTITIEDVNRLNKHLVTQLANRGIQIVEVYYCLHKRSDDCECIKPKPFFLHKAAAQYSIDLENSYTIGDHPHDVVFAENVGAIGIYVLTDHGAKHQNELNGDELVLPSITEAADWILDQ